MSPLEKTALFTLAALLVLAFVVSELRRGETRIAGIQFTRAHAPFAYWATILLSILVGITLALAAMEAWREV